MQNTKSSSVTVTLKIYLFEIQGKILWLIHCRDSFVWNTKANSVTVTPEILLFESCILPSLITKLNFLTENCVLWTVVGWKKLSGNMQLTIRELDNTIATMFQTVKRVLHQNTPHTKISQGLQFCRSVSYTLKLLRDNSH